MNKHNSENAISRGVEHKALAMPYIAMLFGEDGRRWLGLVSIEEFEHAQSLAANPDGRPNHFKLDSLTLSEIYAGDAPGARVFDAPLRQRSRSAWDVRGKTW